MRSRTDFAEKTDPRAGAMKKEEPIPARMARQGRLGRPVLYVLLAALAIAMIIWIPLEWWGRAEVPSQAGAQSTVTDTAPSGDSAPPAGN